MARPSNSARLRRATEAAQWLIDHKVWKQGMTSAELLKAAKAKAAPAWLLTLLQLLGPILLQFLEALLNNKPVPAA